MPKPTKAELVGEDAARHLIRVARRVKPFHEWFLPSQAQYTAMEWWPIAFHNSGKHLFVTSGAYRDIPPPAQREMKFLPFSTYCTGGNQNGVHFQHLGHLYGLLGGPAQIEVKIAELVFRLRIQAHATIWFFENQSHVYVFRSHKVLKCLSR